MTHQPIIHHNTAHLWRIFLPDFYQDKEALKKILHPDEMARADRLLLTEHQSRFIVTRSLLRKTLSLYMKLAPEDIDFGYGKLGKPFLLSNPQQLDFNVSHSHDMALFGFTLDNAIGVDIQKTQKTFNEAIAKKYFTGKEYTSLMQLPKERRILAFYHLWARKEAVIKTLGKGVITSMQDVSVSLQPVNESIIIPGEKQVYYLDSIDISSDYVAAFATVKPVQNIQYWQWTTDGPIVMGN